MQNINNVANWSDAYALDMPEIDDQHKALFVLINRLWKQIVTQADRAEVLKVLDELEQYTISHFAAEETFMRVIGYPGFDEHKVVHGKFVSRIGKEKAAILAGSALTLDILRFLKDWLVDHILVSDKAYAGYHKQKSGSGSRLGSFFRRFF